MPYPHSNSLGKNPPPNSKAGRALKYAGKPGYTSDATKEFIETQKKLNEAAALKALAEKQAKLHEAFFKGNGTIKFPEVKPLEFHPDFGTHAASKYGKPDMSVLPEEGPPVKPPSVMEQVDYMQNLMNSGLITKEQLYASMYGGKQVVIEEEPKPKYTFMGFTQQATGLGEQDSFEIAMKFKVDGIEGLDGQTLYAKQMVSKQFIYGQVNPQAKIVEDMLRQIKEQILEQMKKKGK